MVAMGSCHIRYLLVCKAPWRDHLYFLIPFWCQIADSLRWDSRDQNYKNGSLTGWICCCAGFRPQQDDSGPFGRLAVPGGYNHSAPGLRNGTRCMRDDCLRHCHFTVRHTCLIPCTISYMIAFKPGLLICVHIHFHNSGRDVDAMIKYEIPLS